MTRDSIIIKGAQYTGKDMVRMTIDDKGREKSIKITFNGYKMLFSNGFGDDENVLAKKDNLGNIVSMSVPRWVLVKDTNTEGTIPVPFSSVLLNEIHYLEDGNVAMRVTDERGKFRTLNITNNGFKLVFPKGYSEGTHIGVKYGDNGIISVCQKNSILVQEENPVLPDPSPSWTDEMEIRHQLGGGLSDLLE